MDSFPFSSSLLPWERERLSGVDYTVDIYQAHIHSELPGYEYSFTILSEEEKNRTRRFHFQKDQYRFAVTHAFLRSILASYTAHPPQDLVFTYGACGKPALQDFPALHFNLSHAHERVLLAISDGAVVGADIDYQRPIEVLDLARRFFTPHETTYLLDSPPETRLALFFRLWTYKEAYLKATGEGLRGLSHAEIHLDPLEIEDKRFLPDEKKRWHLAPITAPDCYLAAISIRT